MKEEKSKRTKKYKRHFNTNLIKWNLSYSTQEIAELLGTTVNTVCAWYKTGLQKNDKNIPHLVFGRNLIEFLNYKNKKRKKKCEDGSFFCFKCQKIQTAWENSVDIEIMDAKRMRISGLCERCNSKVNKEFNTKKLNDCQKIFAVQVIRNKHLLG